MYKRMSNSFLQLNHEQLASKPAFLGNQTCKVALMPNIRVRMCADLKFWIFGIALIALAFPLSALAGLGGDATSVLADSAHLKGAMRITQAQAFAVHEIRVPSGTVVREFVSPAGKVFGLAWEGPFMPDMQQLMGSYFDQYQRSAKLIGNGRRALSINEPGLVVQAGGHMRSYVGRAYVPDLLPAGVSAESIK
jgi:Protein of unknown function (DUF2844)